MSEVLVPSNVIIGTTPHSSPVKKGRSGSVTVPPLSLSPSPGVKLLEKQLPSEQNALMASPLTSDEVVEPILRPNPDRFVLFPIKYPKLFAKYKEHESVMWSAHEVDVSKDMLYWNKLKKDEQFFLRSLLGFFAGSDGIVQENLSMRFSNEVQIAEARAFYAFQNMIEVVHSETYSLLIDTYIDDEKLKLETFRSIQTMPAVAKKADWAKKWIETKEENFATRLIAFAVVEGVFFSGSFCAIFWLKTRGIMPGLTLSNEFIARDEGLHTAFAVTLYEEIVEKVPKAKVHKIIKEAVKIEKEFITKSLPCDLIGMNKDLMSQYIEFVADRLSTQLGYGKIWSTANPFDFMERISIEGKDNFFEKKVSTYGKAGSGVKAEDMAFSLDANF